MAASLSALPIGPAMSQPVSGEGLWDGSASFDQQVQAYIAQKNLPGVTLAVTKGGRLVLSKGYGFADLAAQTPMQPSHRTYIGSTSKMLTAIAALQLVEQGELDLEGRIYGTAVPLWGSDPGGSPGLVIGSTGVLTDPGDYFSAMVEGVNNLDPNFPPSESPSPTLLAHVAYGEVMKRTLEWASQVRVKHLLSHTSGLRRSGSSKGAETYKEAHLAVLNATKGPPILFQPKTNRKYSNHGFGLLGYIVAETSGASYEGFVRERILDPLGLTGVVRGGTNTEHYATPYVRANNPFIKGAWSPQPIDFHTSNLALATGGWAGTAQDLVRMMCALDKHTILPVLEPETVEVMETIAYPAVSDSQPLGWDNRIDDRLAKNGKIKGGSSQIIKFLPGAEILPGITSEEEINIAIAVNLGSYQPGGIVGLLRGLAAIVAQQDIPEDYDLFDEQHRCIEQPGFAATPGVSPRPPEKPVVRFAVRDAWAPTSRRPRIETQRSTCIGGTLIGGAAGQSCRCAGDLQPRRAGRNRLVCPIVDPHRPGLACAGRRAGGSTVRGSNACRRGSAQLSIGRGTVPAKREVRQTSCVGGSIRGSDCFCPRTSRKVQTGPNAWRCVQSIDRARPAHNLSVAIPTLRQGASAQRPNRACPHGSRWVPSAATGASRCVRIAPPTGMRAGQRPNQR